MTELPYVVECRSSRAYFEVIAAFDCKEAALAYAKECKRVNKGFSYRVKNLKRKKAV